MILKLLLKIPESTRRQLLHYEFFRRVCTDQLGMKDCLAFTAVGNVGSSTTKISW